MTCRACTSPSRMWRGASWSLHGRHCNLSEKSYIGRMQKLFLASRSAAEAATLAERALHRRAELALQEHDPANMPRAEEVQEVRMLRRAAVARFNEMVARMRVSADAINAAEKPLPPITSR